MEPNSYLLIVLSGIIGTLMMDAVSVVASHVGIISGPVKPSLIGRWGLHLLHGRLLHKNITKSPAFSIETVFGVMLHYSIGIAIAFMYVGVASKMGFEVNSFRHAIIFGLLTNYFPWFILFPSYGFGFFGLLGKGLLASSFFNHLVYGIGLGGVFWLASVHQSIL
jgi:hypothetical protein